MVILDVLLMVTFRLYVSAEAGLMVTVRDIFPHFYLQRPGCYVLSKLGSLADVVSALDSTGKLDANLDQAQAFPG